MINICQAIYTSLALRPVRALLLLMFPAFEGLHDNTKFVIIRRMYTMEVILFKGNNQQGDYKMGHLGSTRTWISMLSLPKIYT